MISGNQNPWGFLLPGKMYLYVKKEIVCNFFFLKKCLICVSVSGVL